jgi:hypothetical protein
VRPVWRYHRFLYRRFWEAGRAGALTEVNVQIVPWMGSSLLLICALILFDISFQANSYPQIMLSVVVMSPLFIGLVLITRVWWRVSNRRIMLKPVLDVNNG